MTTATDSVTPSCQPSISIIASSVMMILAIHRIAIELTIKLQVAKSIMKKAKSMDMVTPCLAESKKDFSMVIADQ